MKLKDTCSLKKSYDQPRQHIKKQRHYFANKDLSTQSYGFSSSHGWMWELDYKESWVLKNWCFWTVVLEKTLESPLCCNPLGHKESDMTEQLNWTDSLGFGGGTRGKESASQCRRCKRHRFDHWVGKIPWGSKWLPTPVLLPGKFHGHKNLEGYTHGATKYQTWLSTSAFLTLPFYFLKSRPH